MAGAGKNIVIALLSVLGLAVQSMSMIFGMYVGFCSSGCVSGVCILEACLSNPLQKCAITYKAFCSNNHNDIYFIVLCSLTLIILTGYILKPRNVSVYGARTSMRNYLRQMKTSTINAPSSQSSYAQKC